MALESIRGFLSDLFHLIGKPVQSSDRIQLKGISSLRLLSHPLPLFGC